MKISRRSGATSNILQIFIQDSSQTDNRGLAGLAFNTGSLIAYYHRDTDTAAVAISLVTMTVGTFTAGGFKEVDATHMPGVYQFCPPDAAMTGGSSVMFQLQGAANMKQTNIEIDLDSQVDTYLWKGTAVPAPATAGVPTVDVNTIVGDSTAATQLMQLSKFGMQAFTVQASPAPTSTTFNCGLTGGTYPDNCFKDKAIVWVTGNNAKLRDCVTQSSVSSTGVITAKAAFPFTPVAGDTGLLVGVSA